MRQLGRRAIARTTGALMAIPAGVYAAALAVAVVVAFLVVDW